MLPTKNFGTILAGAMGSDELSTQPRKHLWNRLIAALACLVTVTMIALLARAPKNKSGAIWFVGFTNYDGQKRLVFQGTNGNPGQRLFAALGTGAVPQAKDWSSRPPALFDATTGSAPPGTNFYFTLKVPTNSTPYYVAWDLYDSPPRVTRWGKVRSWFYRLFNTHGMPGFALRFAVNPEPHYILSTECKE